MKCFLRNLKSTPLARTLQPEFEEAEKGTLEAGKVADLVVLSASPLDVPPERIGQIAVLRTMIAGAFIQTDAAA